LTFTVWRITKHKHARTALNGSGARKYGGRWNSPGIAIVYTAENQSLAVLELLVHLESPDLLHKYVLIGVEIDESLVTEFDPSHLPRNWRSDPPPAGLRKIGDDWVRAAASVALRIPSTVIPAENNFLLNPAHPDFAKLVIGKPVAFSLDPRLAK
jgi:RES domain-containing protein